MGELNFRYDVQKDDFTRAGEYDADDLTEVLFQTEERILKPIL